MIDEIPRGKPNISSTNRATESVTLYKCLYFLQGVERQAILSVAYNSSKLYRIPPVKVVKLPAVLLCISPKTLSCYSTHTLPTSCNGLELASTRLSHHCQQCTCPGYVSVSCSGVELEHKTLCPSSTPDRSWFFPFSS